MNKSGFANGGFFSLAAVYCGSCGGSQYRLFALRAGEIYCEGRWASAPPIQSEFVFSSLTAWRFVFYNRISACFYMSFFDYTLQIASLLVPD